MKIHSIKFKITLLLVVTVTCLVAMLIGFNSIFSEKVNKLKIKSSVGDLLSRGNRRIRSSLRGETDSHAGDTVTGSE